MFKPCRSGFSLVEVVLAVGIFSFVVIGVLGLLTSSMESARLASSDTVLASITTDRIATLRSQPFLRLYDSFFGTTANRPVFTPGYYAEDGTPLPTATNALYVCKLTAVADDANRDLATCLNIQVEFSWPISSAKPNKFSIPTKISRYD